MGVGDPDGIGNLSIEGDGQARCEAPARELVANQGLTQPRNGATAEGVTAFGADAVAGTQSAKTQGVEVSSP